MKKYYYIFCLLYAFLQSCNSPLDVDVIRQRDTLNDPNNLPAVIEINPQIIDLSYIYLSDSVTHSIKIKNITENKLTIKSIMINDNQISLQPEFQSFDLDTKNQSNSIKELLLSFLAKRLGKFNDTIKFNDYKKPYLIIKSIVPTVYGRDVEFDNTLVNNFNGKVLRIYNDGNEKVNITGFEIIDENGVFFNQPKISIPFDIPAKSYESIILSFNPNKVMNFQGIVKLKCNATGFIDDTIKLAGKGY